MLKWIGGIIATVIAGVIIAVIVAKYKNYPKVIVTFVESSTLIESVVEREVAITVYNEGEATAQECQVYLNSENSLTPARSNIVGIKPKETLTVGVRSGLFNKPGKHRAYIFIKCNNYESEKVVREFQVLGDIRKLFPK